MSPPVLASAVTMNVRRVRCHVVRGLMCGCWSPSRFTLDSDVIVSSECGGRWQSQVGRCG